MQSASCLFWIDLEMTGLNPEWDVILEMASLVTSNNLEIIARGPDLVIHQPDIVLETMDAWVHACHEKSGLLRAVKSSTVSLADAYEQTLVFARNYCVPQTVPMCGNSVYKDRAFLQRTMPELEAYFHYRLVDVSSIKELVRRWYADAPKAFFEKSEKHRALDDVYASIEELKHYRTYFFK